MLARIVFLLLLAASTTGCLTFESAEFRLDRDRPHPATAAAWRYELVLRHLESDAKDSTGLASDFADLMDHFRSASESAKAGTSDLAPGARGSSCELLTDHGVLVFRQRGTIAAPESLRLGELRFAREDGFAMHLKRSELGRTNGRDLVAGDSVTVRWALTASSIRIVARTERFEPAPGSRFAERFRRLSAPR